MQCLVDINQYGEDTLECGCNFEGQSSPQPCKSINGAKNSILNIIKLNPSKVDGYLTITLKPGTYYAAKNNSLSLSKDILSVFSTIEFIGIGVGGSMPRIDGTGYSGSFISNELLGTASGQILSSLNIKNSITFEYWDTSNSPIISLVAGKANLNVQILYCYFQHITNRQILSIQGDTSYTGLQLITFNGNVLYNILSSSSAKPSVELQDIDSTFLDNGFDHCLIDTGVFISSKVGKIDDAANKYFKTSFKKNVVKSSVITNSGNDNKLKESDGFISVTNSYFVVNDCTFNLNVGRMITFNNNQFQQGKQNTNMLIIFQVGTTTFYNNSVGNSDDGDDSLINFIGSGSIFTFRSSIQSTFFYNTVQYDQESNSIIRSNIVPTLELVDSEISSGGDSDYTAFYTDNGLILVIDSIITTNKLMIGKQSAMMITDSTISNDHSQYQLCTYCRFNYTSTTDTSLNWEIKTSTITFNFSFDLVTGWKEIAFIVVSSVAFIIVLFASTIFVISILNKRKQQIQSNTYVKLKENIQSSDNYIIGDEDQQTTISINSIDI